MREDEITFYRKDGIHNYTSPITPDAAVMQEMASLMDAGEDMSEEQVLNWFQGADPLTVLNAANRFHASTRTLCSICHCCSKVISKGDQSTRIVRIRAPTKSEKTVASKGAPFTAPRSRTGTLGLTSRRAQ